MSQPFATLRQQASHLFPMHDLTPRQTAACMAALRREQADRAWALAVLAQRNETNGEPVYFLLRDAPETDHGAEGVGHVRPAAHYHSISGWIISHHGGRPNHYCRGRRPRRARDPWTALARLAKHCQDYGDRPAAPA